MQGMIIPIGGFSAIYRVDIKTLVDTLSPGTLKSVIIKFLKLQNHFDLMCFILVELN